MVKKKGGKKKHRGKNIQDDKEKKLEIIRGDEEEYGKILDRKGGPHMSVRLLSGKTVLGVVRGKHRKRMWMARDDIVLVGIRDFQAAKVDILHKYPIEHVIQLIEMGEIPEHFTISEGLELDVGDNIFGGDVSINAEEEWNSKYKKLKESWKHVKSLKDDEIFFYIVLAPDLHGPRLLP